jgi:hypothetical protein
VGVCVGTIFLGGLVVGTATHQLEAQKVRECMTPIHEVTFGKVGTESQGAKGSIKALIGQGMLNWVVIKFHRFGWFFALKFRGII